MREAPFEPVVALLRPCGLRVAIGFRAIRFQPISTELWAALIDSTAASPHSLTLSLCCARLSSTRTLWLKNPRRACLPVPSMLCLWLWLLLLLMMEWLFVTAMHCVMQHVTHHINPPCNVFHHALLCEQGCHRSRRCRRCWSGSLRSGVCRCQGLQVAPRPRARRLALPVARQGHFGQGSQERRHVWQVRPICHR
jgi:hypothetical protein